MNELQKKYGENRDGGCTLQLFGFPSNQFGFQEPAENFELLNCLKYVRPGYGFVPAFPLAGKGNVNGINELPIFTYLKARCASPMGLIANRSDVTWTPIRNNDISWNFQKWLINHDGHPFRRYTSRTTPKSIEDDIREMLQKCSNETHVSGQNNNTESHQTQPQHQQQPTAQTVLLHNVTNPRQVQKKAKKRSFFRWFF